ncbi:MAG: helix-turn-helix transcriptional regulator [Chloroflexi bacterium]|nr:MAG: helix-turn-helix transcriptional regulator [Chloroflexota bacterium]
MPAQVADDLVSTMLRALGDPVRLRLLRELPPEAAAEVPVGELARRLDVPDTVVSQHLRVLTGLGLVGHRRSGRTVYHYVKAEALVAVRRTLAHELPRMFAAARCPPRSASTSAARSSRPSSPRSPPASWSCG